MSWFSWIYHGDNIKQCYYEPDCVVCWIKLLYYVVVNGVKNNLGWGN